MAEFLTAYRKTSFATQCRWNATDWVSWQEAVYSIQEILLSGLWVNPS